MYLCIKYYDTLFVQCICMYIYIYIYFRWSFEIISIPNSWCIYDELKKKTPQEQKARQTKTRYGATFSIHVGYFFCALQYCRNEFLTRSKRSGVPFDFKGTSKLFSGFSNSFSNFHSRRFHISTVVKRTPKLLHFWCYLAYVLRSRIIQ